MSTKKREVIFGPRIKGAKIRAEWAQEAAKKAQRAADRAEAELWSLRMEGFGGPAQPSPTVGQCLNGGLAFLEVACNRCKTRAGTRPKLPRKPSVPPQSSTRCRPRIRRAQIPVEAAAPFASDRSPVRCPLSPPNLS